MSQPSTRKSVAAVMNDYCVAVRQYQDYLDRTCPDLPHPGTLTRLGNAMRDAEKAVDAAVLALIESRTGGA